MSKLTYRNSQGQLVDMSAVAATKVKNEFGSILEQAMHGNAVAITRHDLPKAVLLSYEEFVSLVKDRAPQLDDLSTEFDALLAGMQTEKARQGMADAFNALPSQLGRAAVTAVRKDRRQSSSQPRRSTRTPRAK
ncbi:MAG: type II toxin-antitoxin system prevent-host-death family antitoxin [Nitrospira sp.]|nr:type II toxin-antitoxin system prevent-host-death family antitoxin [Nitrospira sp.]